MIFLLLRKYVRRCARWFMNERMSPGGPVDGGGELFRTRTSTLRIYLRRKYLLSACAFKHTSFFTQKHNPGVTNPRRRGRG